MPQDQISYYWEAHSRYSCIHKLIKKRQFKEDLLEKICLKRFKKSKPTKKNLLDLISLIKQKDYYCPNRPDKNKSKTSLYNWLIDNLKSYFVILDKVE